MEVKKPNKEIPFHSNSFIYNNNSPPSPPQPQPQSPPPSQKKTQTQTQTLDPSNPRPDMIRYRECQRNHAAHLGSHVVDGCGEFMPGGEEGTQLALKCAACGCHRNFHRREIKGDNTTTTTNTATTASAVAPLLPLPPPAQSPQTTTNCYISFSKYHKNNLLPITTTTPPVQHPHGNPYPRASVMMAFGGGGGGAAAESSSDDLNLDCSGQFVEQYGVSKKRFRTKFTQHQKDQMLEFADKIGWKIQKQDDAEVHRFCSEVGIKRQVFKVWMHNNKQAMKKKQLS